MRWRRRSQKNRGGSSSEAAYITNATGLPVIVTYQDGWITARNVGRRSDGKENENERIL